MPLRDELDLAISAAAKEVRDFERELESVRRQLARSRQVMVDAFRLYRSAIGSPHPLEGLQGENHRERPRAEQVLAAMEAAGRPISLAELIRALPDEPERGAISAVVHRAIRRGEVRRLQRGIYELAGSYS
jgi:hypothetical protein